MWCWFCRRFSPGTSITVYTAWALGTGIWRTACTIHSSLVLVAGTARPSPGSTRTRWAACSKGWQLQRSTRCIWCGPGWVWVWASQPLEDGLKMGGQSTSGMVVLGRVHARDLKKERLLHCQTDPKHSSCLQVGYGVSCMQPRLWCCCLLMLPTDESVVL